MSQRIFARSRGSSRWKKKWKTTVRFGRDCGEVENVVRQSRRSTVRELALLRSLIFQNMSIQKRFRKTNWKSLCQMGSENADGGPRMSTRRGISSFRALRSRSGRFVKLYCYTDDQTWALRFTPETQRFERDPTMTMWWKKMSNDWPERPRDGEKPLVVGTLWINVLSTFIGSETFFLRTSLVHGSRYVFRSWNICRPIDTNRRGFSSRSLTIRGDYV